MKAVASTVTPGTKIMGIVKADGYGHGAAAVSKTIDAFVSSYGVATADEALMLRRHGIKKGILVLGPAAKERYRELAELEIRPSISRFEEAQAFSQAALEAKKQAKGSYRCGYGDEPDRLSSGSGGGNGNTEDRGASGNPDRGDLHAFFQGG